MRDIRRIYAKKELECLDNIANDNFKLFIKEAIMKRNSWFVYCIVWICMILFTGSQVHSQEKKQSPTARTDFTAKVTNEDGTVSQVDNLTAVYEPAEWVEPRPQTSRQALSFVLQTANGSERLIEIPFAEIKRIDFEAVYYDPKATGYVPGWYPVRITRHNGSLLIVARGAQCVICDATGGIVESIPLSDEHRVYDRSKGYAERGYVFQHGSLSGVTGIGLNAVAKPLLMTGFTGRQSGVVAAQARVAALSSAEAYDLLAGLNAKEQLVPVSFMLSLGKYNALDSANCFGIRTPQGLRLAGVSSGTVGLRGFTFTADGQKRESVFIGVFHSEFPFLLQTETFPAGPYMVMAFRDALELSGDDQSGTHYDVYRRRTVPNSLVKEIPLSSPIPDELLAEKATAAPRFRISIDKTTIFLTVLNNRLRITPK
jgi:hypothetical protein